jgi:hypothetical protein
MLRKFLFLAPLILAQCFVPSRGVQAEDVVHSLEENEKSSDFKFGLNLSYDSISYGGVDYDGVGIGLVFQKSLSRNWAMVGSFVEAFEVPGMQAFFTQISGGVVYAVTGSLISEDHTVAMDGFNSVHWQDVNNGGFRAAFYGDLSFVNSTASVVAMTGFGISGYYETNSTQGGRSSVFGARFDAIANPKNSLHPVQLFFGILF